MEGVVFPYAGFTLSLLKATFASTAGLVAIHGDGSFGLLKSSLSSWQVHLADSLHWEDQLKDAMPRPRTLRVRRVMRRTRQETMGTGDW